MFEDVVGNTMGLAGDEVSLDHYFPLIKSTMSCKRMRKSNAPIKLMLEPKPRLLHGTWGSKD